MDERDYKALNKSLNKKQKFYESTKIAVPVEKVMSLVDLVPLAKDKLKIMALNIDRIQKPKLADYARVNPIFSDSSTKNLRIATVFYFEALGFVVESTANVGMKKSTKEVVLDTLGNHKVIGSDTWISMGGTKGTSDLKVYKNGKALFVELKCAATKDKQSKAQKEYQAKMEAAGFGYVIITTLEDLFNKIDLE